jgi:hypothetical protein
VAFLAIGVVDGQLDVTLSPDRAHVVEVAGEPVSGPDASSGATEQTQFGAGGEPLESGRFDLFGMWLSAIPMVVIGGPLGGLAASRMRARTLVAFVFALALAEVVTTAIFLDELHENMALLAYAVTALVVALTGLTLLARHNHRVLGLPPVDPEEGLSRARLDVDVDYRAFLEQEAEKRGAGAGKASGPGEERGEADR